MNDHYLKFDDQAQALAAFAAAGMTVGEQAILATHDYAIDLVGTLYRFTGAMITVETPGGPMEMPEQAPVPGWHANVRMLDGNLPDALAAFEIAAPAIPKRVWA